MAILTAGIIAMEVGPVHVLIARSAVAIGGLNHAICEWAGHSACLIPRLANEWGIPGAQSSCRSCRLGIFLDDRGSRFHEDLAQLDNQLLPQPDAAVIADNVLNPGAPLWLGCLARAPAYYTHVVRVCEFGELHDDWMTATMWQPGTGWAARHSRACLHSPFSEGLARRGDEVRGRSIAGACGSTELTEQSQAMREGFAPQGILCTLEACCCSDSILALTLPWPVQSGERPGARTSSRIAALRICLAAVHSRLMAGCNLVAEREATGSA